MKPISNDMILMILSQRQFAVAELFEFTLVNGVQDFFTDLDIPITYNGDVYKANSLRIEGLRYKLAVGLEIDEQDMKISAYPDDVLAGSAFFGAIQSGLLDGAYLKRSRAFWLSNNPQAYVDYATAPLEVVTLFTGRVASIDKIGRTHVELKLKSPLSLLDIDMPRNTYQPSCLWNLYDSGCTVSRPTFTDSYVVVSSNPLAIEVASVSPQTGADALPYYAQGRLLFTSGINDNLEVTIANNDSTVFYLRFPLVNQPSPGDTFDASAGCSKQSSSCELKFSNLVNFRAFPRVPPVVLSV